MKLSVTSFAKACFRFSSLALVVGLSHLNASATTIFSENFNAVTGGIPTGEQYGSTDEFATNVSNGNAVEYGASLAGWTPSGSGTIHAVDYGSGNKAVMIFSGNGPGSLNSIESSSYAANALGTTYTVSYDFSAAVYQQAPQATQAGDQLRFLVLYGTGTILLLADQTVGAWTGDMSFTTGTFSYVGDGGGDVRFVISSASPNNFRFAGAVDNFSVAESASSIPEPSTYAAIFGVLALGAAAFRRRQARA